MIDHKAEIKAAAQRIAPHIQRTPVMCSNGFGLSFPIEMKLEQFQHTGSFKVRGAFNTLLSDPVPEAGIVAASGGNHGAAVAYAAHSLGHRAQIFLPELAGPSKIALVRNLGVEPVVVPGVFANAQERAEAHARETGAMQIHAYDAPGTVIGQATCLAEWEAQGLEADTVLIAVGGGGLIGGAMSWLRGRRRVVGVEPELAPTLTRALAEGPDTTVEVSGVAANSLGSSRIGRICYELAIEQGLHTVTVTDDAITRAQRALWRERRLLVEPAGAVALAALMSGAYRPEGDERVAVLICGGNIAPDPIG